MKILCTFIYDGEIKTLIKKTCEQLNKFKKKFENNWTN